MTNYQKSIDNVLTYIDANLNEKQDLDKLAEIANLSKFHFLSSWLSYTFGFYQRF